MRSTFKYVIILLFFLTVTVFSQNRVMDSLKAALKNATHDTTRCNILNAITESEPDEKVWESYNKQLREISEKNISENSKYKSVYLKYLGNSLSNMGYLEYVKGDANKQIEFHLKCLKIREEVGDKGGTARTLINLGRVYYDQGICPKALEYYEKSLDIYTHLNDKKGIAFSNYLIGLVLQIQGNIKKALDCYQTSLKISEELENKQEIGYSMNSIAMVYAIQGENDKALNFYLKCLKILEEIDDKRAQGTILANIGSIYSDRKEYNKALENFKRSLKLSEELGDKRGVAYFLNCMGVVYANQTEFSKAIDCFKKYKKTSEEISDNLGIAMALRNMASLNFKTGQLSKALQLGHEALTIDKKFGFVSEIGFVAEALKQVYQKQKKYKEAFEMFELEIKMRDSINNDATQKASIKRELQYTYEKKAAQDSVKTAEEKLASGIKLEASEAKLKQEQTQRYALYGGLLLVGLFSIFMVNRFRVTSKQKIVIEQQKKVVEEQKLLVENQKHLVEEKQKEILDSIHYAQRIQRALITPERYIDKKLKELEKWIF